MMSIDADYLQDSFLKKVPSDTCRVCVSEATSKAPHVGSVNMVQACIKIIHHATWHGE